MKYNSIGEQLIAKAKELDPSYTPDKFNDMSEAIDVILNKTGGSSAINLDDYIDSEALTLKSEELFNELVTRVIINKETFGYLTLGEQTVFFTLYTFNGVLMLQSMLYVGDEQLILLKCPALGEGLQIEISPYGIPLIDLANPISTPRIVSYDNNMQSDLAIGDGLVIENGALKTTGSGGSGSRVFEPTINSVSISNDDTKKQLTFDFSVSNFEITIYLMTLIENNKPFTETLYLKTPAYDEYNAQIMFNTPLSLVNVSSVGVPFHCFNVMSDATNEIKCIMYYTLGGTHIGLDIIFSSQENYNSYKQLASALFTNNTKIKITIKTDE